ncbi:MAG: hypothetical protein ABIP94_23450, partial [Planctomycetota bacterium]
MRSPNAVRPCTAAEPNSNSRSASPSAAASPSADHFPDRFNHRSTCIVVANHPTQMDVTAIGACLGGACTIVKSTVYRRRLVRPLMVG